MFKWFTFVLNSYIFPSLFPFCYYQKIVIKQLPLEFDLIVPTCNPITQEAKAEGLQVQGQAGLYSEALSQ